MLKKWLSVFCLCLLATITITAQDSALFLYTKPVGVYAGEYPINGLFAYNAATGESRDLINNPRFHVQSAEWTPDGEYIMLIGGENREGPLFWYRMETDGDNLEIWYDGDYVAEFAWSPDRQWIAFTSTGTQHRNDVFVMPADGGTPRNLTNHPSDDWGNLSWSPDSQRIAFSSTREPYGIHIVNLEGETETIPIDMLSITPAWSPNGESIAFTAQLNERNDIYILDLDGQEYRRLAPDHPDTFQPMWSPDGSRIVFTVWKANNARFYFMNMPDGNPAPPPNWPPENADPHASVSLPVWSPDGLSLAFTFHNGDETGIYVAHQGVVEPLILGDRLRPYGWQPTAD